MTSDIERSVLQVRELQRRLAEMNALIDIAIGRTRLSRREQQVLELLAGGATTKEISVHLGLAYKTIDGYRATLMNKFRVHDVVKLTRGALRLGYAKL